MWGGVPPARTLHTTAQIFSIFWSFSKKKIGKIVSRRPRRLSPRLMRNPGYAPVVDSLTKFVLIHKQIRIHSVFTHTCNLFKVRVRCTENSAVTPSRRFT